MLKPFITSVSLTLLFPAMGVAEQLSNTALFTRCYAQLTQQRPGYNSAIMREVRAGRNAIEACISVFDQAKLVNNQISNTGNREARAVLSTLHALHSSWFDVKDIPEYGNFKHGLAARSMYDTTAPALYYTRALFTPAVPFSSIVTSSQHLRAVRTTTDPDRTYASVRNVVKSDFAFTQAFSFAPQGDILGVTPVGDMNLSYSFTSPNATSPTKGSVAVGKHQGGGVLGDPAYLLMTVEELTSFRSRGGEILPRKWGRAVFNDLLCRSLPVVRYEDADKSSFVSASSPIEFRKTASCTQCHVSMDRMTNVIRNVGFMTVAGGSSVPAYGGVYVRFFTPTQAAEKDWVTKDETGFHLRRPAGHFYFRNYRGNLVDVAVEGPAQMGTTISNQDDFYICAAKRYYEYFAGVSVDIGDPGSPDFPAMNAEDRRRRDAVIAMGQKLKQTQDARQLIVDLMNSEDYKKSDFGLMK